MSLRRLRLRAVWLLVLPFLWFARPTPATLAAGALLVGVGLALRAWAAGTIHKERVLATTGPYAHVRHPLYAGSLLMGTGVALAGGHWGWPAAFLAFYAIAYGRTMAQEEAHLAGLFGADHGAWAARVPALVPRVAPLLRRSPTGDAAKTPAAFSWARYRANREWEAALGAAAALAWLAWRMGA